MIHIFPLLPFPMINPVAFSLGGFDIRWYGISYVVGILSAFQWIKHVLRQNPMLPVKIPHIEGFFTWIVIGIILGGRIGFVLFYTPEIIWQNPLGILNTLDGGMSFHGGLLGVIAATVLYCRRQKIAPFAFLDILALGTPIGLFCGRIANFINAEHYGRESTLPWAMIFPTGGPVPRHPSQLYEAVLEGILLFIVLNFCVRKEKFLLQSPSKISGFFLLFYGVFRFCVEFFRTPDGYIGFLTYGQAYCVPMLLYGLYLIMRAHRAHEAWKS